MGVTMRMTFYSYAIDRSYKQFYFEEGVNQLLKRYQKNSIFGFGITAKRV